MTERTPVYGGWDYHIKGLYLRCHYKFRIGALIKALLCTSDQEITNPNLNEVGNDTNAARAGDVQLEGGSLLQKNLKRKRGDERVGRKFTQREI